MHKIAPSLLAVTMGLLAGTQAAWSETQSSVPPAPAPAQSVLRPYYVLPIFPFFWPVPPGHPAASPQAEPPQSAPYPSYPFVIWLPAVSPAILPAPSASTPPTVAKPPAEPPVAGAAEPIPSQVSPTLAEAAIEQKAGSPTASDTPPAAADVPSPLPKSATEGLAAPRTAEPQSDVAVVTETPTRQRGRHRQVPAIRTKPATPAAAAKSAPQGATGKRKLCWKDGKLDVCK